MMLIVRRNAERRHIRSGESDMWLTFYPEDNGGTLNEGFGSVSLFNEIRLLPGGETAAEPTNEAELVTYVYKGALALESPSGGSGVITAGEFHCVAIGRILGFRAANSSPTAPAHLFRIYLRLQSSQLGLDSIEARTRFTAAQRRNVLCTIASPDGRGTSLRIRPDAHVYSSILDSGRHIAYELRKKRGAWLHVVYGGGSVNGVDLSQGDGVGVIDEPSVSLTARENTEVVMIDTIPTC